jgi:hypothetical protein
MTEDQHKLFWRLWADACDWQGWSSLPAKEREQKRRDVLASLGFTSATLIDTKDGFDSVKKRFLELAGKVVVESDDAGHRRRVLARIDEAMADLSAAGYPPHSLKTILAQRFETIEGASLITDLHTIELENLSKTLTARLAAWNKRHAAVKTAFAEPPHTLCNANAANMQAAFKGTPDLFLRPA